MKSRTLKIKAMSILLTLVMLVGMLPMTALAADGDSFVVDEMTYTVLSESAGTVSLTRGKDAEEVTIPSTVEYNGKSYTVTVIGFGAFQHFVEMKKVTIPETVTTIKHRAFLSCRNLRDVSFDGESLLETIENDAFAGCMNLTSFTIPDSVTNLGAQSFSNTGLTSVHIPASVTSIGSVDPAFATSSLTAYTVANDNPNYSALDGVLFNKDKTTLIHYPQGKTGDTYEMPESVTAIGYDAFTGSKLVSLTIPANVQTIQTDAISGCVSLKSLSIPATAQIDGNAVFLYGCTALEMIKVSGEGGNLTSVDGVLFANNGKELKVYPVAKVEESYTVPAGTETIAGHSLKKAKNLKSVTIPTSVIEIGNNAFRETNITDVYYSNTEEHWNKIALGSNVFPDGVQMHYSETATHNYGTEWKSDGDNHWRECSCGAKSALATHSGGVATCVDKAACSVCGAEYGDLAAHNYSAEWKSDEANHWHECSCGAKTDSAAHSGGVATCTDKAECSICSIEYGDLKEHSYGTEWKTDGTNHWHECSCGAKTDSSVHRGGTATCTDKAVCSICDIEYGSLKEHAYGTEWKSDSTSHWRECSCGEKTDIASHSGGTANCKEKAVCSTCGISYGDLAVHQPNANDGDCTTAITCSVCGDVTTAGETSHAGGTATCINKAVCDACGTTYGELATHTYENGKCSVCKASDPNYQPPDTDLPQTGDTSNMMLWIILLFISGGALIVLTIACGMKKITH